MGLGSWPAISLAEARLERDRWAAVLARGEDPVLIRREQQDAFIAERDKQDPTFAEAVDTVFEARQASLRDGGKRGRWRAPLDLYMIPAFGRKRLSILTQRDIVDALKPIWKTKYPTAEKAIQRTNIVLRSSKRMGLPADPDIVDAAKEMLGIVKHTIVPTAAIPWQEIPALYASLGSSMAGECNRWLLLTLVRMDAGHKARVSEVGGDVWTVPKDRIKGMEGAVQDFRVPLSLAAQEVVERARFLDREYLFQINGRPISNAAVAKRLKTMNARCTPHGYRTSFRVWAQETQEGSRETAEMVLDHVVYGKVERAYARSDLLDRRRTLMDAWARFVTGQQANVVQIRR